MEGKYKRDDDPGDVPPPEDDTEPELTNDQIMSLEEPIDATAHMSDDDVDRLAAALAAGAGFEGEWENIINLCTSCIIFPGTR